VRPLAPAALPSLQGSQNSAASSFQIGYPDLLERTQRRQGNAFAGLKPSRMHAQKLRRLSSAADAVVRPAGDQLAAISWSALAGGRMAVLKQGVLPCRLPSRPPAQLPHRYGSDQ
jgi:hypothetical protein